MKKKFLLIITLIGFLFTSLFLASFISLGFCFNKTITVKSNDSIQKAINSASEGDTILVEAGTYYEQVVVNKTLTLVGEHAETTIIDGKNETDYIFHITANNVIIENFTLKNTNPDPSQERYAIRLYKVTNVSINKVNILNTVIGIDVLSSNYTKITRCVIKKCKSYGLQFHYKSCNNTVVGNLFENNPTAFRFADTNSRFNMVYHNNFINNTNIEIGTDNHFDNDYPAGGNYWSNHTAPDLKSGTYQNETGSDGILDSGYPDPPEKLWDRYPLANPLTTLELSAEGKKFQIEISTNLSINSINLNKETQTLTVYLVGDKNTNGSCRITIPKELLSCDLIEDWHITSNGYIIENVTLEDENNTYLYMICSITEEDLVIKIKGTKVIPEFNIVLALLTLITFTCLFLKKIITKINSC